MIISSISVSISEKLDDEGRSISGVLQRLLLVFKDYEGVAQALTI